jgi:hypothetical protein
MPSCPAFMITARCRDERGEIWKDLQVEVSTGD